VKISSFFLCTRKIRRKYLTVYGEYDTGTQNRLRIHGKYLNVFGEYAERIYAYMENSPNTQRDINVDISVDNNTNFKFLRFFLSTLYGLSPKTILRYCPFNPILCAGML